MESKTKTDAASNQEINKENMATAAAAALAAAAVKSKVCRHVCRCTVTIYQHFPVKRLAQT